MAIASAISSSSSSSVCASNFPKSTTLLSSFPSSKSSSNHISFKSNNKTFTHCLSKSLTNLLRCANKSDGSVTASESLPIEKRIQAFPTVLNIDEIREILPHRFPFLLVDRVAELNPGVSAVAIKNVTINDNFFPGHFPERPIMPGVLMVEAMAQTGGIVLLKSDIGEDIGGEFFFAGVDKIRFRKPVIAGDTLVMRMELVKLQKQYGIAKLEGKAFVDGKVVCEGEFMLAFARPSKSKLQ